AMTRLAVPLLALVALLSGCNVSQTAPKTDYPYSSTQYLSWYPGDTAGQQNAAAIEKVRSAAPNGTLIQGIRTAYAKLGNGPGEAWALGIYKEYRLVMYELESLHLSALSQGAITSPEQVQALVSIAGSPTKVGLPD